MVDREKKQRPAEGEPYRAAADNESFEGTGDSTPGFGQPHGHISPPARTRLDLQGQGSGQEEADREREARRAERAE